MFVKIDTYHWLKWTRSILGEKAINHIPRFICGLWFHHPSSPRAGGGQSVINHDSPCSYQTHLDNTFDYLVDHKLSFFILQYQINIAYCNLFEILHCTPSPSSHPCPSMNEVNEAFQKNVCIHHHNFSPESFFHLHFPC